MIQLNKIVKYLIYSDLIFYTGWGLISPIFALFLVDTLKLTAFVVGMAAAINLVARSLLRVPFGMIADKSQKKAYYFMFLGLLVSALIPVGYILSKSPWHIYLLQAVLGAGLAMSTAGWTGIFAKYMDKGKESTEWGIDAVAVGIGPGIAGALGGLAVTYFSFNLVFIAVTIIGLIGVFILPLIKKDVMKNQKGTGKLFIHHEIRRLKKRFH
ncbi:MFS transporter [Candidatus Pacearchaeota archaeon]|nr:MFS transporter [Candidatus Pacearchaeota archaeon]